MKLAKTFRVDYYRVKDGAREVSHSYEERWEWLENMHCPACGKGEVWHESGPGDYYVGENHLCLDCGSVWTIQGPYDTSTERNHDTNRQRLEKLR